MKLICPVAKFAGMSLLIGLSLSLCSCAVHTSAKRDDLNVMEVSVPMQKMALYRQGQLVKTYPVSTSKFGLGDEKGSYRTPLGKLEVAEKIGAGRPAGAVFKSRQWTGEVIKPDAPGRDPIVSRILWLKGLEPKNQNAFSRCIYIHGTAAERDIGKPVSYGCVRMKSKDVIDLHDRIGEGSKVLIVKKGLWRDLETAKEMGATIEVVPVVEPLATAMPLAPAAPATQTVRNDVAIFKTGTDVLRESGFETSYLVVEP
ncbi:MAG TPA: L,D-transpeptidase [Bacteroidia bacterium]|nr:L,D-transpeptidase [Bacteroidia bacterium]